MKTLFLEKRNLDLQEFKKRMALERDYTTLFTDDVKICTPDGQPVILYKRLEGNLEQLRNAVLRIRYEKDTRTSGLKTHSAIFGYNPRNIIRKDYCSATRMAYSQPEEHTVLVNFAETLSQLYAQEFPGVFAAHQALTEEKILPQWRIGNTPFTSGIVNKNNPLKYHFDAGNFAGVLSNMIVLRNSTNGGYLSCPEYDCAFAANDSTVILFDGQKILHGVTPIQRTSLQSYRYSVVYYTLQQMWQCKTPQEEIQRIRDKHTKRERKRATLEPSDLRFTRNPASP